LVIECDACPETFEGESGEFNEVWAAAKRDGWTAKKVGDLWIHECPTCREKSESA
jgi:hypothetical protein